MDSMPRPELETRRPRSTRPRDGALVPTPPARWRHAAWAIDAASVALLIGIGVYLLGGDPRISSLALVGDDAGYYLNFARNHCLGHGVSFDRLHPSNGFNPLYTLLLIAAFESAPVELSTLNCYRIGVLLDFAAIVASVVLVRAIVARFVDRDGRHAGWHRFGVAVCTAFYVFFVCPKSYYGMDTPLVLLLGSAYLVAVLRGGLLSRRRAALDGALLGLLFLARVDTLPFLLAAYLMVALSAPSWRGAATAVGLRLPFTLIVVGPYLAWGHSRFGTWMPISARLKTSFPHWRPRESLDAILGTSLNLPDQILFAVAFLAACALLLVGARRLRRDGSGPHRTSIENAVLGLLGLYVAARLGYMLFFSRLDVQGNYAILAHVFTILVFVRVLQHLAARAGRFRMPSPSLVGAGYLMLLVVSTGLLAAKLRTHHGQRLLHERGYRSDVELGLEIAGLTDGRDVVFGGAFGMAGFFSDRAWMNADGVANTFEYQVAVGADRLEDYLRQNGVTLLVYAPAGGDSSASGEQSISVVSPLFQRASTVRVGAEDVVRDIPIVRRAGRVRVARYHSRERSP
jgi:hypothetical protein